MRKRPSFTAAWVAAARSAGARLPTAARLVDDPWGARFAEPYSFVAETAPLVWPLLPFVVYMQVRTRAIDDALLQFLDGGGAQVVVLGAGFDCRAVRFRKELGDKTLFVEVDHPATQARKRDILAAVPSAPVSYLAWDFESRSLTEIGSALSALGLDMKRPTLTIWEGVTMYLTEGAVDATVRAVSSFAARGSPFVVSYFDRELIDRPHPLQRAVHAVVSVAGEPFTFGWAPAAFAPWMKQRGFRVDDDRDATDLARALLPAPWAHRLDHLARWRHIALARRV
jgi:methyltransferase (TIGR00027 family)